MAGGRGKKARVKTGVVSSIGGRVPCSCISTARWDKGRHYAAFKRQIQGRGEETEGAAYGESG